MRFEIDFIAFGILGSVLALTILLKKFILLSTIVPSLAFSRLKDLKQSSWRSRFASIPHKLHAFSLICFMIAFIDPHFLLPRSMSWQKKDLSINEPFKKGIAIYLILDQSGSMAKSIEITTNGRKETLSKIHLLQRVTEQFIQAHSSDLIGLISFARVPRVLVPLTLDREVLLHHIRQIQVVNNPEEDGTAMDTLFIKQHTYLQQHATLLMTYRKKKIAPILLKARYLLL